MLYTWNVILLERLETSIKKRNEAQKLSLKLFQIQIWSTYQH